MATIGNAALSIRNHARHQIRVHTAEIKHPVSGDPMYQFKAVPSARQCSDGPTHAWRLGDFAASVTGRCEAMLLPDQFNTLCQKYCDCELTLDI